ncbi:MAG: PHP domain-containing protein [Deltaproteobacteria bacterium]|jgi:predicted metal-dependent phosphoesterase TrpH|nr:PHP domain-containing protein [Deltaproteobacteria bacterium]
MLRVDLHVHSTASDGTVSPRDLVKLARFHGLAALALCDHDTAEGLDEFFAAGREMAFRVIGGVELSLEFKGTTHLLGLGVGKRGELPSDLEVVKEFRHERNLKLLERLAQAGVKLSWERLLEISGGGQMGRPHFARAMVESGYCQSLPEAFDRYLAKGRPTYVNKVRPVPQKALRLLRERGFAPVLAHPISLGLTAEEFTKTVPDWIDWGLVGLEAYHPDHPPAFTEFIAGLGKKNGLVVTAGSDYHGANKKTPLSWVKRHSPLGLETIDALNRAMDKR